MLRRAKQTEVESIRHSLPHLKIKSNLDKQFDSLMKRVYSILSSLFIYFLVRQKKKGLKHIPATFAKEM